MGCNFLNYKYMDKNTYQTAFPNHWSDNYSHGMSLRDYFAARAMQALIARIEVNESDNTLEINASITTTSYLIADAMLKAREEK